jgi:hypothetical protein
LRGAACVEPLSKNVPRSRWFNLPQRVSQGSVTASESRIQSVQIIPISHLVPLLEFNHCEWVRTRFEEFSFGSIRIDGITYEHDVVMDQGNIRKRNKKPSKKFRDTYGHTPLSVDEDIPWKCERLVVGTGTGALPVMDEVKREARRRKIKLDILPTAEAIRTLQEAPEQTNAILHVAC